MSLLQQESELKEIVKLVGIDSLSPSDRLVMEAAQMLREDFLQQNAMSDTDSYCPIDKQYRLLAMILEYYDLAKQALESGAKMKSVFFIPARDRIGRAKDVPTEEYVETFEDIRREMAEQLSAAVGGDAR